MPKKPTIKVGQVWQMAGWRCRVQGFSKLEDGWVKVREVGGSRARGSYPPKAFENAVLIGEPRCWVCLGKPWPVGKSGCPNRHCPHRKEAGPGAL